MDANDAVSQGEVRRMCEISTTLHAEFCSHGSTVFSRRETETSQQIYSEDKGNKDRENQASQSIANPLKAQGSEKS